MISFEMYFCFDNKDEKTLTKAGVDFCVCDLYVKRGNISLFILLIQGLYKVCSFKNIMLCGYRKLCYSSCESMYASLER